MEIKEIWGIPVIRFKELIELFDEAGYDLKDEKQFDSLKRNYFNKIEKENRKIIINGIEYGLMKDGNPVSLDDKIYSEVQDLLKNL